MTQKSCFGKKKGHTYCCFIDRAVVIVCQAIRVPEVQGLAPSGLCFFLFFRRHFFVGVLEKTKQSPPKKKGYNMGKGMAIFGMIF